MAKQEKNTLSSVDIDSFDIFGSEDPFAGIPAPKKTGKRTPVLEVPKAVLTGVGNTLKDTNQMRRFVSAAMPDGYGSAINTSFEVGRQARQLYNDAVAELRPAMPFFQRVAGKLSSKKRSYLPAKVQDTLRRIAETKSDGGFIESAAQRDENSIAAMQAEVFQTQMEYTAQTNEEGAIRQTVRDQMQLNQSRGQAQLLEQIRANTARQVGYQDQVTARYMKKSLELQFRSLIELREMRTLAMRRERTDGEFFSNIMRNTGLPDYQKLPLREAAAANFRDRLMERGQRSVTNYVADFAKSLTTRMGSQLRGSLSGIASMAQAGDSALEAREFAAQMEREMAEMGMAPESGGAKGGKMAGEMLSSVALPFLASPIRKLMQRSTRLRRAGARAGMASEMLPEKLNEWAQSDTNSSGWAAPLLWMLKDAIPKFSMNPSMGEAPIIGADKPVPFDNLTRRSITEIIPGYLARILREVRVFRTGDESTDLEIYNIDRGEFTSRKQATKDAARRLFSPAESTAYRSKVDDLMQQIGGDQLNEQQRKELMRQVTRDVASGRTFNIKRYTDSEQATPDLTLETKQALEQIFNSKFKDTAGNTDDEKVLAATRQFSNLRNYYADPKSKMSVYRDSGYRELLGQMGVMGRLGFSDRVDYGLAHDMLLGLSDNEYRPEASPGAGGPGAGPIPPRREWTPGGVDPTVAADQFGDRVATSVSSVVARLSNGNMRGLAGKARRRMEEAINRGRASSLDLEQGFAGLNTRGRDAVAAIVSRAAGVRVSAAVLMQDARKVFDNLKPADRREVEAIIAENSPDGDGAEELDTSHVTTPTATRPSPASPGEGYRAAAAAAPGPSPSMRGAIEEEMVRAQAQAPHSESMDKLISVNEAQLEMLENIVQAIVANGGGDGQGNAVGGGKSGMMRKLLGKFGSAGGAVARWYGRYSMGVLKAPFTIAKMGMNAVGALLGSKDVVADIYVVGETSPVLKKRKLLNGDYRDLRTKKPIRLIKDIKGPVIDLSQPDAAPVIDQEMLDKGFYTLVDGKPSIVRRLAGIAGGVLTTVAGAYAQMFKLPFMLTGGAARLASQGVKKLFSTKKDVFVKGQADPTKPRLRAVMMDGRHYFNEKGRGITSIKQLDGSVIFARDRATILIGPEDYEAGLVDIRGRPLESTAGRLVGIAGRVVGGVAAGVGAIVGGAARGFGKVVGGAYNLAGGLLGGGLRKLGGMFGMGGESSVSSAKQVDLLQRIHDMLDTRLPGRKLRANSWQERRAKAEEAKKETKQEKDTKKSVDLLGSLSKLFSKGTKSLASIFGFGDDEDEDKDGGDTTVIAGGGGGNEKDAKRKRRLARARPKGRLGRMWAATGGRLGGLFGGRGAAAAGTAAAGAGRLSRFMPKGFGLGALLASMAAMAGSDKLVDAVGGEKSTAGKVVGGGINTALTGASIWSMLGLGSKAGALLGGGGAASGAAATGAAGAGTTAAGGVGTTVGGGAAMTIGVPLAIVAGLGYAGVKGYKTYKYAGYTALRGYRMTQYGVDYNDPSDCQKIIELEALLEPTVKPMGAGLDLVSNQIKMEDIYKAFGIDDGWFTNNSDERKMFDVWFNARFKPVYLRWQAELRTIAAGTPLQEVDDSLKADDAQKLIRAARNVDPSVYAVKAGPFGDLLEVTADRVQQVYIRSERELKDKAEGRGGLMRKMRQLNGGIMGTNVVYGKYFNRMNDWLDEKRSEKFNDNSPQAIAALIGDVGKGATKGGTVGYGAITVSAAATVGLAGMGQLSALQGVRLRTYGLGAMDKNRVAQLLMLEREMLAQTQVRPGSPASTQLNVMDAWNKYGLQFGLSPSDQGAKERWVTWFQYRFTPTVLAYATAAASALNSSDLKDIDSRLTQAQKFDVATATSQAKCGQGYDIPVWRVYFSPWGDVGERLNQDIRTIQGPLVALKEGVKTDPLGEERAPGQTAKLRTNQSQLDAITGTGGKPQGSFMDKAKSWLMGSATQKSLLGRGLDTAQNMASYSGNAVSNLFGGNFAAAGADVLRTVTAPLNGIFGVTAAHPGNGTGGSINDVPLPAQGADSKNANERKSALQALIHGAAKMAGVSPALMMTIAGIESSWRPAVGAATSSAKGLYQFISGTWETMMRRYGKKYGIAAGTTPYDPRANALLGAEFLKENAQAIRSVVNRDPTDTELYAAHFMGAGGAAKMLKMDPSANAVVAFPAAARANKPIFYNADGSARSVSQVMAELDRRVSKFRDPHSAPPVASFANVTGPTTATPARAAAGSAAAKADFSNVTSSASSSAPSAGVAAPMAAGTVAAAAAAAAPMVNGGTAAPALNTPVPSASTSATIAPTPAQLSQYATTQSVDTQARKDQVQQNVSLQKTESLLSDQLDVQRRIYTLMESMAAAQLDKLKREVKGPEETRSNAITPSALQRQASAFPTGAEMPKGVVSVQRRLQG